jgi:hypothetical protein
MGWNSWNAFRTEINEDKVMGAAQKLVDSGLSRLGYVYVNIDDGWWLKRRAKDGRMEIRTNLFPSAKVAGETDTSFKPFVDQLHKLGLKAGIYTDIGRNACSQAFDLHSPNLPIGSVKEREVGLEGHLDQDMRLYFQEWGFDYIKIDACGIADFAAGAPLLKKADYRPRDPLIVRDERSADRSFEIRTLYQDAAASIRKYRAGQDFVMSICTWGRGDVRTWGHQVGNAWRTADDIGPTWDSMLRSFDSVSQRAFYARPGSWNDPDMLYIGAGDFSARHLTEARSHFSLWAILNSPLLIGYDLRQAPKALLDIWGNADVVAINQDRAGHQGVIAYRRDDVQVIVKTLWDGRKAVAILNRGKAPASVVLNSADLNFDSQSPVTLRDLWRKETKAPFTNSTELKLAPHETLLFAASGRHVLGNGVYVSEIPARVHVAAERLDEVRRGVKEEPAPKGVHADSTPQGTAITIGTKRYSHGIGMMADTRVEVLVNREFDTLRTMVGVDQVSAGSAAEVQFSIYGDGRLLKQSAMLRAGDEPFALDADIADVKVVELIAVSRDGKLPAATVSWGDARLIRR